jgi:hypothetical protein
MSANAVFGDSDPLWNTRWGVLNPRHLWLQVWDLSTLCLLIFTCIATPYEVAFLDGVRGTNGKSPYLVPYTPNSTLSTLIPWKSVSFSGS